MFCLYSEGKYFSPWDNISVTKENLGESEIKFNLHYVKHIICLSLNFSMAVNNVLKKHPNCDLIVLCTREECKRMEPVFHCFFAMSF